ncbi:hypothetical protein HYFRA_00012495 [Hymenoscyphus fraxineus]|uniref:RING-type domain-containing protein n=1 Tax=Hymenoscyphus fraxineus TaxID=746836 RepID=A0A9N9L3F1_9HELO|nr:hypothetical protein HYFRA_00012495 [Hymenoscyphus fraxineus]
MSTPPESLFHFSLGSDVALAPIPYREEPERQEDQVMPSSTDSLFHSSEGSHSPTAPSSPPEEEQEEQHDQHMATSPESIFNFSPGSHFAPAQSSPQGGGARDERGEREHQEEEDQRMATTPASLFHFSEDSQSPVAPSHLQQEPEQHTQAQSEQEDEEDDDENKCAICMSRLPLATIIFPCAHDVFHYACILDWFREQYDHSAQRGRRAITCPVCRRWVKDIVIEESSSVTTETTVREVFLREKVIGRAEFNSWEPPTRLERMGWVSYLFPLTDSRRREYRLALLEKKRVEEERRKMIDTAMKKRKEKQREKKERKDDGGDISESGGGSVERIGGRSMEAANEGTEEDRMRERSEEGQEGNRERRQEDNLTDTIEREMALFQARLLLFRWQRAQQLFRAATQDHQATLRFFNAVNSEQLRALMQLHASMQLHRVREREDWPGWGREDETERTRRSAQNHFNETSEMRDRAMAELVDASNRLGEASLDVYRYRGHVVMDDGRLPEIFYQNPTLMDEVIALIGMDVPQSVESLDENESRGASQGESRGESSEERTEDIPDEDPVGMIEREVVASQERMADARWERAEQQHYIAAQDRERTQRYHESIIQELREATERIWRMRERLGDGRGIGDEAERRVQALFAETMHKFRIAQRVLEDVGRYRQESDRNHRQRVYDRGQMVEKFYRQTANSSPRNEGLSRSNMSASERVGFLDGSNDRLTSFNPLSSQRGYNREHPRYRSGPNRRNHTDEARVAGYNLARRRSEDQANRNEARDILFHIRSEEETFEAERAGREVTPSNLTPQDEERNEEQDGGQSRPALTSGTGDGLSSSPRESAHGPNREVNPWALLEEMSIR